jgi:arabinose-5-phosphate isomerase
MRPIEQCCVAPDEWSLREIYVRSHRPPRRSGAILLVDKAGRLTGIFTDSDLARLFEHKRDPAIDRPITEVMTPTPITAGSDAMLIDAIRLMATRKISELPIVDGDHRPLGLIDITDVIGLLPNQPHEQSDGANSATESVFETTPSRAAMRAA